MQLRIGENIKRLRHKSGMTQERLAELLGVSSVAVSKWESSSTCPDISLLIPMSEIFAVSADELLGIENGKRTARLNEVRASLQHIQYDDSLPDSKYLDAARQAVAEFPADEYLQHELAWALKCRVYFGSDLDDAAKKQMTDESEKILLRLIDSTKDEEMRCRATYTLVDLYANCAKDTKRALEAAVCLPKMEWSREIVKAGCICNGSGDRETEVRCLQEAIKALTSYLCHYIALLSRYADNSADMIEMRETANLICSTINGNGGDLKWDDLINTIAVNHLAIARAQMTMGNTADALASIGEMCRSTETAAEKFGTEYGTKYRSIYLNSLTYEPGEDETCERMVLRDQIGYRLAGLRNECFDSIREDEKFISVTARLSALIKEEERNDCMREK